MPSGLQRRLIRLASEAPKGSILRTELVGLLRTARVVPEKIRAQFRQVGERGDRWILEVAGSPYDNKLTDTDWPRFLKGLGLWWDRGQKVWKLDSGAFVWNTDSWSYDPSSKAVQDKNKRHSRNREKQKKAWPKVKAEVQAYNKAVEDFIRSRVDVDRGVKGLAQYIDHHKRVIARLDKLGIKVQHHFPGPYQSFEPILLITGNTYPVKDVMKAAGFRWGQSQKDGTKGWIMSADDSRVVGDQWMNEAIRVLDPGSGSPAEEAETSEGGVFSSMSTRDLVRWLNDVVKRDMQFNEFYDGEVSNAEVKRRYMKELPNLSVREQQEAMDNWQRGGLPVPKSDRRYRWRD